MSLGKNDVQSHKQLQNGLQLRMQLIFATTVDLDENENENYFLSSIISDIQTK